MSATIFQSMTIAEITRKRFWVERTATFQRGQHYYKSWRDERWTNIGVNSDYVSVSTSDYPNISATLNGEAISSTLYGLKPGSELKIVTSKLFKIIPIETLTVKVRE